VTAPEPRTPVDTSRVVSAPPAPPATSLPGATSGPIVSGRRRRWALPAGLAAGALLLAGCGASDEGAEATSGTEPRLEWVVTGTDELTFEPDLLAVPAGDAVEIILQSEPAVEHDLVVEEVAGAGSAFSQDEHDHDHDDDDAVASSDLHVVHALAGEQARSLFTIDQPGVYEIYCSIPGHREAGMVGTLEVVAPER
jgi:uncharacterized cupredoxin-like copper-binding protein